MKPSQPGWAVVWSRQAALSMTESAGRWALLLGPPATPTVCVTAGRTLGLKRRPARLSGGAELKAGRFSPPAENQEWPGGTQFIPALMKAARQPFMG